MWVTQGDIARKARGRRYNREFEKREEEKRGKQLIPTATTERGINSNVLFGEGDCGGGGLFGGGCGMEIDEQTNKKKRV